MLWKNENKKTMAEGFRAAKAFTARPGLVKFVRSYFSFFRNDWNLVHVPGQWFAHVVGVFIGVATRRRVIIENGPAKEMQPMTETSR